MSLEGRRASMRIGIVAIATGLAVAFLATSAMGHTRPQTHTTGVRPQGLSLSKELMKSARWIKLPSGKKVWGVPLTLKVSRGKVTAHVRSYGACAYCDSHSNVGSSLCMSSYPNTVGQNVSQYYCNGSANQEWIYEQPNYPYLRAYNTSGDGLCLNNWGYSFSNGNRMGLWSCDTSYPSMWFGIGGSAYGYEGAYMIHLYQGYNWSRQCVTTWPGQGNGSAIGEYTCDINSMWQAFLGPWTTVGGVAL